MSSQTALAAARGAPPPALYLLPEHTNRTHPVTVHHCGKPAQTGRMPVFACTRAAHSGTDDDSNTVRVPGLRKPALPPTAGRQQRAPRPEPPPTSPTYQADGAPTKEVPVRTTPSALAWAWTTDRCNPPRAPVTMQLQRRTAEREDQSPPSTRAVAFFLCHVVAGTSLANSERG